LIFHRADDPRHQAFAIKNGQETARQSGAMDLRSLLRWAQAHI